MKRLLIHIAVVLVPVFTMAQAPQKFNFQVLVRNSSNELVYNKQVTVNKNVTLRKIMLINVNKIV